MTPPSFPSGWHLHMLNPMKAESKERGRLETGKDKLVGTRLPLALIGAIDTWAKEHADGSRSAAIRRLIEIGLSAAPSRKPPNPNVAAKAFRLAKEQVEKLADPSIPEEERHIRKQKLIRGPKEFREHRRDLHRPKR
jgi:hypothetical protein